MNQRPPPQKPPPGIPPPKQTTGAKAPPPGRFAPPPRLMVQDTAPKTAPPKPDDVWAVAQGKKTWAELMGMSRQEAFGIAQSAYRLFEHGQREKGLAAMEGLVVVNPKVGAFHALLGAMQGRLGAEELALASYTTAIKLEPNNLSARVNRAELFLKQGALDKALDDLVTATRIDPQGKTALGKRALQLARTTSQGLKELLARAKKKPAPPRR
jgi:Flp pilus assembly protein TadD